MGKQKKVLLYSTGQCPKCREAKQYLQAQNIVFVEFDIQKSRRGAKEFARLNGRGVPLLIIGDELMHGFSRKEFNKAYKKRED